MTDSLPRRLQPSTSRSVPVARCCRCRSAMTSRRMLGWVVNPAGTDSARSGAWQRTDPQPTAADGPKQLGDTPSGAHDLVTGALAGNNAGQVRCRRRRDVRALPAHPARPARTSCSPSATTSPMPATPHPPTTSGFRSSARPAQRCWRCAARTPDVDAAWTSFSASLTPFAGQGDRLPAWIEAADLANDSLVEAAVDDETTRGRARARSSPRTSRPASRASPTPMTPSTARPRGPTPPAPGCRTAATRRRPPGQAGRHRQAIVDGTSAAGPAGFALAEAGPVRLSFWFILTQSPDYDDGECSEALVAVDGALYGVEAADFVARLRQRQRRHRRDDRLASWSRWTWARWTPALIRWLSAGTTIERAMRTKQRRS